MKHLIVCLIVIAGYFPSAATAAYSCTATSSSFLWEVCYDEERELLRLKLKSSYYNYCNVPRTVVNGLLAASSKGRYYNRNIKGRYSC